MIERAVESLLAAQNPDGGWPTHAGRTSSTEATSFATLALARLDGPAARASAARGVRWLVASQNDDGSWPLNRQIPEGSWTTAPATLTLGALARERPSAVRGARWLLRQQPRTLGLLVSLIHRWAPDRLVVKLDPGLKGWSWTAGAASFVEPTAYAVLALKKLRPELPGAHAAERIDEAERMVYDRTCREGGWNYGNSTVLEADLSPYADVTALTLVALADHRAREANQRSLAALRRMLKHVDSGLTLGWASLCFAAYDQDVAPLRARLHSAWERTRFLGDVKSVSLALLALSDGARSIAP